MTLMRLQTMLEENEIARIKEIAFKEGRSLSNTLRQLIRKGLECGNDA